MAIQPLWAFLDRLPLELSIKLLLHSLNSFAPGAELTSPELRQGS